MFRRSVPAGALAATLALAPLAAPRAQTAGYTGTAGSFWFDATITRDGCLGTAGTVMANAGYINDPIGPDEDTLFSGLAGDVVLVRCFPNRRMVVVFYHARQADSLRPLIEGMRDAMVSGRVPPRTGGGGAGPAK